MRRLTVFSAGLVVVSAIALAAACNEGEALTQDRVVLFPTVCASHGERFTYRIEARSSVNAKPCPGEVTTQFTGSAPIRSTPTSNCSVEVVIPAEAASGPVTITFNGETVTIPRFNIPCGNDPETGTDAKMGEDTMISGDTMTSGDTMMGMDADAGCKPEGTASAAPAGSPSPSKLCVPGRISGLSGLGTKSCCTIAGIPIVSGSGVTLPESVPPGVHTLTCVGPLGTGSWPITVTAGTPPKITSATPVAGTREITIVGTGFDGITAAEVIPYSTFTPRMVTLKSNTGTTAVLDLPADISGELEISFRKTDCGQSNIKITVP